MDSKFAAGRDARRQCVGRSSLFDFGLGCVWAAKEAASSETKARVATRNRMIKKDLLRDYARFMQMLSALSLGPCQDAQRLPHQPADGVLPTTGLHPIQPQTASSLMEWTPPDRASTAPVRAEAETSFARF